MTPACSEFPEPGRIACRFHGTVFDIETGSIISWCPEVAPDGTAPGFEVLGDLSKNQHPLEVFGCRELDGGIWLKLD